MVRYCVITFLVCQFALTGCTQIGPSRIQESRFDYNEAAIRTWNEQLLLNLVRLRYRDTPFFLEVNSITTNCKFRADAGFGAEIDLRKDDGEILEPSLGAAFEENPTITYSPLQGEKFAKQLMSRIPLEIILLLGNSGWGTDRILRVCVQAVNKITNATSAAGPTPVKQPDYEQFLQLSKLFREAQAKKLLAAGVSKKTGEREVILLIRQDAGDDPTIKELRRMLGLKRTDLRIPLNNNPAQIEDDDITFITRSLMGVLFYLSQGVEAPIQDREEGKVTVTKSTESDQPFDWNEMMGDLFHVRASSEKPSNAFTRVNYRDKWFYIADDDLTSKSTFMLLAQLFWLQAGDIRNLEPTLTIPVG